MQTNTKQVGGGNINYAFRYISTKLLLIKTGYGGTLEGYDGKYTRIAQNFISRGFSILICDNSPDIKDKIAYEGTMELARELMSARFSSYDIHYFGVSRGGYQFAIYGYDSANVVSAVLVNPPLMINFRKQMAGLRQMKLDFCKVVVGEKDPSSRFAALVNEPLGEAVSIELFKGADHNFSGMLDEFVALADCFVGDM